jgi:hypothetical protein
MVDRDREHWIRHLESVQWNSISIFTTVVAGLLAYSFQNKSVPLSFIGLLFTNMTMWFTAGFRSSRRLLGLQIEDADCARLLATKGRTDRPSMWSTFVATFGSINALWLHSLIGVLDLRVVYSLAGIIAAIVAYTAHVGRGLRFEQWEIRRMAQKSPEVDKLVSPLTPSGAIDGVTRRASMNAGQRARLSLEANRMLADDAIGRQILDMANVLNAKTAALSVVHSTAIAIRSVLVQTKAWLGVVNGTGNWRMACALQKIGLGYGFRCGCWTASRSGCLSRSLQHHHRSKRL